MFPLVGLGLVALFLLSSAEKDAKRNPRAPRPGERPPPTPPTPSLPPEQASAFQHVMGRLMYVPDVALLVINGWLYKAALPTDQPNLMMIHPGPGIPIGENEWGAWFAGKFLNEQGFDIWVPTNAHVPVALPMPALFLQPGDPPPPEGFALLITGEERWPPMPAI